MKGTDMGVKSVTGSSRTDFADAFEQVRAEYPPRDNTPVTYVVTKSHATDGGFVGPMFYVDVDVSADYIE